MDLSLIEELGSGSLNWQNPTARTCHQHNLLGENREGPVDKNPKEHENPEQMFHDYNHLTKTFPNALHKYSP